MQRITLVFAVLAAVLAGCVSFTTNQSFLFTDEDGNLIRVDYGSSKRAHTSNFTAPNGKVFASSTSTGVRVTLPDGERFVAWNCLNPLTQGAMYRSDDEEWMYLANGATCTVFQKAVNPEGKDDYLIIFEGIVCKDTDK